MVPPRPGASPAAGTVRGAAPAPGNVSAPDAGPAPGAAAAPGTVPALGDAPGRGDATPPAAPGWARSAIVAMVGLAAILPLLPNLPIETAPVDTPSFFTGTGVQKIPAGALAFTLPYDIAPQNDGMMWQAASGMRFRILGGDAFVRGPGGQSTWHWEPGGPKVLMRVLRTGRYHSSPHPPMTHSAVVALREMLARQHVPVVLVDTNAPYGSALALLMTRALRVPAWQQGPMYVWLNVQNDLRRHRG